MLFHDLFPMKRAYVITQAPHFLILHSKSDVFCRNCFKGPMLAYYYITTRRQNYHINVFQSFSQLVFIVVLLTMILILINILQTCEVQSTTSSFPSSRIKTHSSWWRGVPLLPSGVLSPRGQVIPDKTEEALKGNLFLELWRSKTIRE